MYRCSDCKSIFNIVGWTKDDENDGAYCDCCPECGSIDYIELIEE